MNLKIKDTKEKSTVKKCGMITCIHCIGDRCDLENCDFYERVYCQEH